MLHLHVVQAAHGDCLLLEHGSPAAPRFVLVDGGPEGTYERHLRPLLADIAARGASLDLAMLSHVDNDHILGLLAFFAELRLPDHGLPPPPGLWFNAFAAALDPNGLIAPRLAALGPAGAPAIMASLGQAVAGIGEGVGLRGNALVLGIPLNAGAPGGLITVEALNQPLAFGDLTLRVVGPTQANLAALEEEWLAWLDAHEDGILAADPFLMANADQSVPNLSSIMVLAEADGRRILLTGDGRSDHLLDGLAQAGLLDATGRCHVDVLKLPHHGSDRNITRRFLRAVTADIYVASANGRDGNPDLATLIWLVEAARDADRAITLAATNDSPSLAKLLAEYPAAEYGYALRVLPPGEHALIT